MLPKKNRVNKKDIDFLFKEGKFIVSANLIFRFILARDHVITRISFIAPKRVAKLAVKRNMLRKRGYDVLKKYINQFPPGLIGVFVFKKYQEDISIIEHEIKNALNKIN